MEGGEGGWKQRRAVCVGVLRVLEKAGRRKVLPSRGNSVTDGRGRVGMGTVQAEGLWKEPDRLKASSKLRDAAGSMVVRAWSRSRNSTGKRKMRRLRGKVAEDSKLWTSGNRKGVDDLIGEVLRFLRVLECFRV